MKTEHILRARAHGVSSGSSRKAEEGDDIETTEDVLLIWQNKKDSIPSGLHRVKGPQGQLSVPVVVGEAS